MSLTANNKSIWEFLLNTRKSVIVYGMGNGADKIFDILNSLNIIVSGIIASDDFVRGQSFRGFKVMKLSEAEEQFGELVILIAFGSQLPNVIEHIYEIAHKHTVLVPSVPVIGNGYFNKSNITNNKDDIEKAYSLLSDNKSKEVFSKVIEFYYNGKLSLLKEMESDKKEAFNNILKLSNNEKYLDLGAYRGDTIAEFLKYAENSSYLSITAVEPDKKNFSKLCDYSKNLKNVTLVNKGIWNKSCILTFSGNGGRNSALSPYGRETEVISINELVDDITYIKMDIEGAEEQAIDGAKIILQKCKPKLNIAAYHKLEDFYRLILQIHSIVPEYKFYLRHHPYIPCWDTNLYCVVN